MSDPTREAFETWISAHTKRDLARYPNFEEYQWLDQYRDIAVQLAWEAWQESRQQAMTEAAGIADMLSVYGSSGSKNQHTRRP